MKRAICFILVLIMVLAFSGCGKDGETSEGTGIDYMVLVNKLNKLPEDWEDKLETIKVKNSLGDDVEVEKKAYDAYLELKSALEKEDVHVDLDSARRSVSEQQRIMDDFIETYGAEYAAKTVATPGYSEHHTGLALDLYLNIDGVDVYYNEDMVQYPEIWEKIHDKLAEYGFILRYLEGKEHITGYGYEPWHIRYIDNPEVAAEIMDKNITFEGYLKKANETDPVIELKNSEVFTEEELSEAAIQIKCKFASFAGCELKSLKYAGDTADDKASLDYVNLKNPDGNYTHVALFLMDFHSEGADGSTFDKNKDYSDYEWYLAKGDDGELEIVSWGY